MQWLPNRTPQRRRVKPYRLSSLISGPYSSMNVVELMFFNYDASPPEVKLQVSRPSIEPIMAWYGAYYSGDRYNVFVDGKRVEKDQNGELVAPIIEGTAR